MDLLKAEFKSKLGIVQTYIESDKSETTHRLDNYSISTFAHKITLETFELQNEWIPKPMNFEASIGWRWFIEKINNKNECLTIYCMLIDPKSDTIWGQDSGENLDAIEIENKTHQIHIGTEDGEIMQSRARKNVWMPNRFESSFSISNSLTDYIDYGFKTTVPDLILNEKAYFHFLVAENPIKQSIQYPNERDVSTWYAVDMNKEFLDNYLKRQKNNR